MKPRTVPMKKSCLNLPWYTVRGLKSESRSLNTSIIWYKNSRQFIQNRRKKEFFLTADFFIKTNNSNFIRTSISPFSSMPTGYKLNSVLEVQNCARDISIQYIDW